MFGPEQKSILREELFGHGFDAGRQRPPAEAAGERGTKESLNLRKYV